MEKIKQKVEHVLGKDHHDTTTTSGTTGTHGTTTHGTTTGTHHAGSDPTGPHDSRLANKADPRVDSDRLGGHGNTTGAGGYGTGHNTGLTGTGHGTHTTGTGLTGGTYNSDPTGPHDSRLANKVDPRVDSDRLGGHGNTTGAGGYGTGHNTSLTGTGHGTHTAGTGLTGGTHGSDPSGPHDTRMANKLDPRVSDSDRIGGHSTTGAGGYGTGLTGGNTHGTHTTGSGLTGNTHGTHTTGSGLTGNTYGSDPTGPHDSRMANKLDPTVDSDRIGATGNYGTGHNTGFTGSTHGTHTTGTGLTGNTHGTHNTGTDLTGGNYGTHPSSHLPGPAERTAGPHSSDVMNKLDPRVDSDLDGSKTVGGDRTFG